MATTTFRRSSRLCVAEVADQEFLGALIDEAASGIGAECASAFDCSAVTSSCHHQGVEGDAVLATTPPIGMTCGDAGDDENCGRTTKLAISRSSIGVERRSP